MFFHDYNNRKAGIYKMPDISVLIIDDEPSILKAVSMTLKQEHIAVTCADNGTLALDILKANTFDLILLDIIMPDQDGFSILKVIRSSQNYTPVILLSGRGEDSAQVKGLELGADDYIPKPFRPRELISRMNSVLRRYHRGSQPLEYHELKADTVRGLVYKNNVELTLSALEYRLLLLFLSNQGIVLTRSRLLDELWDMAGEFVNDNTLTVYIKRLREKIEADPAHPEYIKTIRGLGYKLGD